MIVELLYSISPYVPDALLVIMGLGLFVGVVFFSMLPGDLKKFIINYCLNKSKRDKKVMVFDLNKGTISEGNIQGETVEIKTNKMKKILNNISRGIRYMWGRPVIITFSEQGVCEKPEFFREMQKFMDAGGRDLVVDYMNTMALIKRKKKKIIKTQKDKEELKEYEQFMKSIREKLWGVKKEHNIKVDMNEFISWCEKGELPLKMDVIIPIDYDIISSAAWGVNGFAIAQGVDALADVKKRLMKMEPKEIIVILMGACVGLGVLYILVSGQGGNIDYTQLAQVISNASHSTATTAASTAHTQNPSIVGP